MSIPAPTIHNGRPLVFVVCAAFTSALFAALPAAAQQAPASGSATTAAAEAAEAAAEASQLGFTGLQDRANALVSRGRLDEALPLLKELVQRIEANEDADFEIDTPLFLIATGHIQKFIETGNGAELQEAIVWFDKLEKEYPNSEKLKDALLKKKDALRVLGRNDEATELMRRMLAGEFAFRLNFSEETDLLQSLTQIYYGRGELAEGLPYFSRLMEITRDGEERALAAAAAFEALFEQDRVEDALRLIPILARDSEVRYRPRFNVALLKASDELVEGENPRLIEAAILLNLAKTTDLMIERHERSLERKRAQLEQRRAFGGGEDVIDRLQQEIRTLENNLEQLRALPTSLRNELLVRRARNYTKTGRRYEAFWMFYGLMRENPDHPETEYYHYAAFSNALQIDKDETAMDIGREYRERFPDGEYYSDVTAALAITLRRAEENEEFLQVVTEFLTKRPLDASAPGLFAQWASLLIQEERYEEMIAQAEAWGKMHTSPAYEDGIHYWIGLAHLQTGAFAEAAARFGDLINTFPTSSYAEDGLLRKGIALYYNQEFEAAREALLSYRDRFPDGPSLDQAHFFLGEVENLAGDFEKALEHFREADALTDQQEIHDSANFRIGAIYETLDRHEDMAEHFQAYVDRYGEQGRLTDAIFQLGRAYEYLRRPNAMLALYRETIEKYVGEAENTGVDALVEGYAEKYDENKTLLVRTVEFLDRLENDLAFREKIVTDRGFLFEHFYNNKEIDPSLYNRLRNHPAFTPALLEDLAPIAEVTSVYREQLSGFPEETPEDFFRRLLERFRESGDRIAATRMLMGLYRSGVELEPREPFDTELLERATPRVILYIADYERDKRRDFAVEAWNRILTAHPQDDAAIVAHMRLAEVGEEQGDLDAAYGHLEAIVEQFPGTPKLPAVILRQGELLTAMGRTDDAREKYQYILRVPGWRGVAHARALYQTGLAFMADDAFDKAHGFFERTFLGYAHFGEWSARAYLADAEALLKMGARQDALNTLREAAETLEGAAPPELMESINAKLQELQS